CVLPFQFRPLLLRLLVQPLNRRQRHALGVRGDDVLVVRTNAERSVEILGHGADVGGARVLFEVPSGYWQRRHFSQDRLRVNGCEVLLEVAVARADDIQGANVSAYAHIPVHPHVADKIASQATGVGILAENGFPGAAGTPRYSIAVSRTVFAINSAGDGTGRVALDAVAAGGNALDAVLGGAENGQLTGRIQRHERCPAVAAHSQTVCGANTELIIHGGEEIGALRVRPDETALMNRSGTISDGKGIISVRGILETSGHCGVAAVA